MSAHDKHDGPAILFGGIGSERLVSTASTQLVATVLPEAELLFWAKTGSIHRVSADELRAHARPFTDELVTAQPAQAASIDELLQTWDVRRAIVLGLHGVDGESGELQRKLEARRIPYTGSGADASRTAYDKAAAKQAVAARGGAVAEARMSTAGELGEHRDWVQGTLASGRDVFAKPRADGSSVGLYRLRSTQDFERMLELLRGEPERGYLLEAAVLGRELTTGVVEWSDGERALPSSEVLLSGASTFGYDEKYVTAGATEITPAELPHDVAEAAKTLALDAHRAVGCRGYSRTDCIWDGTRMVFLEINTLPGLTPRSFITQQLQVAGFTMREFLERQLAIAHARLTNRVGPAPRQGIR